MERTDGRCCRCLNEAEGRPALLGLACMARLNPKILLMGFSNGFCRGISNVVTVHEERHLSSPLKSVDTCLRRVLSGCRPNA
jgi:hypothetical protein